MKEILPAWAAFKQQPSTFLAWANGTSSRPPDGILTLQEVAMFARNVSIHLKPNTLRDFQQTFEKEVLPLLRKQPGFRDEITFIDENKTDVTAISLWESKEQAETYSRNTYPTVLKALDKFLDSPPKVRVLNVMNSTSHKITAADVAA
jgi:hypothetical protein